MKRVPWAALGIFLWLGFNPLATTTFAQDTKRVVVLEFEGPGASGVRKHVVAALQKRSEVELVGKSDAESAADELGVSFTAAGDFRDVGKRLQIAAFVGGTVEKRGRQWRATVWVRDGTTGDQLHEEPWTRKKRPQLKAMRKNFWKVMGKHIMASTAPEGEPEAEPEPEPAAEVEGDLSWEDGADEEDANPGEVAAKPALIASAGGRMLHRSLGYEDTNLPSYSLGAAFAVAASVQWYPMGHLRSDFLADIGLDLDAEYAIALESTTEDGQKLDTTAYELGAGLIYRIPLEMFEPRFRVGVLKHVFDVAAPDTTRLPSMDYTAIRVGAGTAVKIIEALSFDVALAYLFASDGGDLSSAAYFPDASVGGLEVQGGAQLNLDDSYGFRLGADFRRYFFDLGAASANDDYLRLTLAFVYRLAGES